QDGLPGLAGIGQDRRIDVNDDLVPLRGHAGIESLVERDLGEEAERVRLLLDNGRPLDGLVHDSAGRRSRAPALIQRLSRSLQGLDEERADLRLAPAPDDAHAVVPGDEVEGAAAVPVAGFPGLDVLVDAPPAAHDALDVLGGAGAAD